MTKFNEVINDPIMEPCPRCNGVGYHGFGSDEPDWCENCGGNQYNIRPGEEKRAMEVALTAALAVDGVALQGWQPIESAPKVGSTILVVGQPTQIDGVNIGSGVFTAYWDDIDSSFCLSAATWLGPFIKPSCWQPLPPPPAASDGEERSSPPQQGEP